jgi:hypothetical protein
MSSIESKSNKMSIEEKIKILTDIQQTTVEQLCAALLNPSNPLFPYDDDFYPSVYYFNNVIPFLSDFGNNILNRRAVIGVFKQHNNMFNQYNQDGGYSNMMNYKENLKFIRSEQKRKLTEAVCACSNEELYERKFTFITGCMTNTNSIIYQSFFNSCLFERNTIPIITDFVQPFFILQKQEPYEDEEILS